MKLNRTLLNIIKAVQYRKQFELSEQLLYKGLNVAGKCDWLSETKLYFVDIDDQLFEKAGIKKNLDTFYRILDCQLPGEVEDTEYHELDKFEVAI